MRIPFGIRNINQLTVLRLMEVTAHDVHKWRETGFTLIDRESLTINNDIVRPVCSIACPI